MADDPVSPGGSSNPRLPWVLFAASTAVAVLAATGFVYLIGKRTTGPVEVLRAFYEAVNDDDCEEAYSFHSQDFRARTSQAEWCRDTFPGLDVPASFEVERVTLEGEVANVELRLPDGSRRAEVLVREDSAWRIGVPEGLSEP